MTQQIVGANGRKRPSLHSDVRIMTAKVIGRHIWAGFLFFVIWFGLAFIFLLMLIFVPEHPPQGVWPLLVCAILAFPAAIYAWRASLRRQPAEPLSLKSQAVTLLALSLFWWLLYFVLFVVRKPVSKDAMYAGILAFFIVGPIPVLMGLHFASKIYRERFSLLYASALVLAFSPLLMFFFLIFSR